MSHSNGLLTVGDVTLDEGARQVTVAGQLRTLNAKETLLLAYFMRHAGRPIPRLALALAVWRTDQLECVRNTIEVHVCMVRAKIEDEPREPRRIVTLRGYGYRFVVREKALTE